MFTSAVTPDQDVIPAKSFFNWLVWYKRRKRCFLFHRPQPVNIEASEVNKNKEENKDAEVFEDHLVHHLTKNFLETFCMYISIYYYRLYISIYYYRWTISFSNFSIEHNFVGQERVHKNCTVMGVLYALHVVKICSKQRMLIFGSVE